MEFTLSAADAKRVYTLVEECGEMWDDPAAWQGHIATSLERLIGGFGGNFVVLDQSLTVPSVVEGAMSKHNGDITRQVFSDLVRDGARFFPAFRTVRRKLLADGLCTATLEQLVGESDDGGAAFIEHYLHPIAAGQMLYSAATSVGTHHVDLAVLREAADQPFCERHRHLISAIACAIGSRSTRRLTMRHQAGRHGLSPRANEVLDALLEGDSEKQIAARLGLATPTVHEHVTALYRYFGAHSRGELMAYFIRRRPAERTQPRTAQRSRWAAE